MERMRSVGPAWFTVGGSPILQTMWILSLAGRTFQLDYNGGDGNDLELIVSS